MKRFLTGLLLSMALVTNACALEVPIDTTVQNLNGSQQLIKFGQLQNSGAVL